MLVFKQIPGELDAFDGDLVLAVVGEDERPLRATNAWLDWRLFGSLSDLLIREVFQGKLGEKCLLPTYGRFLFDRVVLIGGGLLFDPTSSPEYEKGQQHWRSITRELEKTIQDLKVDKIGLSLPRFETGEQEKALLKHLQSTELPTKCSLFLSRASKQVTALGF